MGKRIFLCQTQRTLLRTEFSLKTYIFRDFFEKKGVLSAEHPKNIRKLLKKKQKCGKIFVC